MQQVQRIDPQHPRKLGTFQRALRNAGRQPRTTHSDSRSPSQASRSDPLARRVRAARAV